MYNSNNMTTIAAYWLQWQLLLWRQGMSPFLSLVSPVPHFPPWHLKSWYDCIRGISDTGSSLSIFGICSTAVAAFQMQGRERPPIPSLAQLQPGKWQKHRFFLKYLCHCFSPQVLGRIDAVVHCASVSVSFQ